MVQQPPQGTYWRFTVPGVDGQPGGTFRVTPENAPKMITYLQSAVDKLRDIDRKARAAGRVAAPMGDPYSGWAIRTISRRASDDEGCHGKANRELQDVLNGIVGKIQASMTGYGQAERVNVDGARGIG